MILIKNKINDIYSNPSSNLFKAIYLIKKYQKIIQLSIFITFIVLPITYIIKNHLEINNLLEKIAIQNKELEHQKISYKSLFNKGKSEKTDYNLTTINNTIKKIAQKHQLNIDSLNWNLEQGKSIELKIVGNSHLLFSFINEINKTNYLKYNLLTLTKSTQNKKIELNAILVVVTNKE